MKLKKVLTFALTLALCLILAVPALAANPIETVVPGDNDANYDEHDVYANFNDTTATVYSVDITWGSLEWNYSVNKGTWDPDTLTYSNPVAGAWSVANPGTDDTVTVTNRSNAGVAAEISMNRQSMLETTYVAGSAATGVTYKNIGAAVQPGEELDTIELVSADNGTATGTAVAGSFVVSVSGNAITQRTLVSKMGVRITALAD